MEWCQVDATWLLTKLKITEQKYCAIARGYRHQAQPGDHPLSCLNVLRDSMEQGEIIPFTLAFWDVLRGYKSMPPHKDYNIMQGRPFKSINLQVCRLCCDWNIQANHMKHSLSQSLVYLRLNPDSSRTSPIFQSTRRFRWFWPITIYRNLPQGWWLHVTTLKCSNTGDSSKGAKRWDMLGILTILIDSEFRKHLYIIYFHPLHTQFEKKNFGWPEKGSQLSLQHSWVSNKLHCANVGSYRQLLDRKESHPSHRPSGHEHVPCRHRLWDSQLLIGGIGGTLNTFQTMMHPGRLTWNPQITHLERNIIFQTSMFMFHVNLQGCIVNNSVKGSSKSRSDIVVAQRFGTLLVLFLPPAATQKNHNMGGWNCRNVPARDLKKWKNLGQRFTRSSVYKTPVCC